MCSSADVHLALLLSGQRLDADTIMTGETHINKDETDETSLAIDTSSVLKLPAEILLEVLSLLNVADLLNIREVSC